MEDTDNLWVRISDDMQLETPDNARIRQQREWLLRNDKHLATIASRAEPYLYLMVEEIERRELPMELITVPMIESMFDPHARSRSNAVGLWQFVPATGKNFGLRHDNWYDGRRDVLASTNAALDYLEYLNRFLTATGCKRWPPTMPVKVGCATLSSATSVLANRLTTGRSICPRNPDVCTEDPRHGGHDQQCGQIQCHAAGARQRAKLRVVETGSQLDLNVAAQLAGLRTSELKEVNPALSRGVMSPRGPYRLLVPIEYADTLELALTDLPKRERIRTRSYQVTSGDTLSRIAQNHGVSVSELKLANNLRSNSLRRGQQLVIPTHGQVSSKASTASKPQQLASRGSQKAKVSYKVRSGDNLWSISQAHGVSHAELAKWNGLNAKSALKPGMKLVVYPKQGKKNDKSMVYQVRRGDSISSIAARFQVAINDVMRWNQLDKGDYLKPVRS